MSYCRREEGNTDVELIATDWGHYCVWCSLGLSPSMPTKRDAIEHMEKHRSMGDRVPEYVMAALRKEENAAY